MQTLGDYFYKAIRIASVGALAAALGVGLSVAPAQAQYGHDDRYGHGDYDNRRMSRTDIQRLATVTGYADGYEHGIIDRRNHASFNYRHSDEYRRGSSGYDSRWGNGRDYQNWYRQAYAKGYSDGYYGRSRNRSYDRSRWPGYGQYPGYGNYPGYYRDERGDLSREEVARRASQNGYYAGFQRGQYDASNRNRPNPQGHGAYQFAFDGFDREWGYASTYQQYYRSYFIRGYNDAYNRRVYDRRYNRY